MSFDYPQQRPRRRKGGMSGIVMLLIIGGVFFIFMQSRGPSTSGGGSEAEPAGKRTASDVNRVLREADESRRQTEIDEALSKSGNAMPAGTGRSNSDWSMDGVDTKKKVGSAQKAPSKTQGEDGWSMEGLPTKKKSSSGFELNNPVGGDVKPAETDDWSMKDVDPKKKKTTEGDWSFEEHGGKGGK